jgi:DNA-directed RNA polymerase specialized sigma24 family protein
MVHFNHFLAVTKAVGRNSPNYIIRTITDMCYRTEYRLEEAAEILGINEETAKSRMLRGHRQLRCSRRIMAVSPT